MALQALSASPPRYGGLASAWRSWGLPSIPWLWGEAPVHHHRGASARADPPPMGGRPELLLHRSHACARPPAQIVSRPDGKPHAGHLAGFALPGHHRPAPRSWSCLTLLTPPALALTLAHRAMLLAWRQPCLLDTGLLMAWAHSGCPGPPCRPCLSATGQAWPARALPCPASQVMGLPAWLPRANRALPAGWLHTEWLINFSKEQHIRNSSILYISKHFLLKECPPQWFEGLFYTNIAEIPIDFACRAVSGKLRYIILDNLTHYK